ncbi:tail fiber protein [Zunongwangia pacifica]|uniref:Tail fiber protein n=1 Tax=Zunongwangia pacifica TaxID=2911062 RepID=A0A9X1ZTJ6_9FLAO|nr:tail fiber protein [Zunongwangia pacifica]MCL6220762.1 tail fiber protein [Zunongwangia pacifica]
MTQKYTLIFFLSIFLVGNAKMLNAQTVYSGIYKTFSGNTGYHHLTRNSGGNTSAVYINQEGSGDILTLSSGIYAPNQNNRLVFRNNGSINMGERGGNYDFQVRRTGAEGSVVLLLEADSDNSVENSNPLIKMLQDGKTIGANIGFSESQFGIDNFGIGMRYSGQDKNDVFIIKTQNGFVGIGTKSPDSKLTVRGKIHSQEVKIDLNGAVVPDYVFLDDYNLKSLEEIESFIDKNGHLENIPSAKQVEEEGWNVKSMNLKMLEKIEELTLYVIEQNKINKEQQEEIAALKKQLHHLTK